MSGVQGIVLFSGGLDSLLAAKALLNQKIQVIGLHCAMPFEKPDSDLDDTSIARLASQIGLSLTHYRCDEEYLSLITHPKHGYGKKMNPCIDCKIFFIRKAFDLMKKLNAEFVATGEVVGQRPMSQMKHMLNHIEKETDMKGRLLRPLSARLLKPTIAELKGIVDRNQLFDISGRGRHRQMELARLMGITEYKSPAGGCLLTDPGIARRVRDLFNQNGSPSVIDMYLLTVGRHFRISTCCKAIVGRNELENNELEKYRDSLNMLFIPDFKGPSIGIKGTLDCSGRAVIMSLMNAYSKSSVNPDTISIFTENHEEKVHMSGPYLEKIQLHDMML